MEGHTCIRCKSPLGPNDQALTIYQFTQTVGVRPKQKSSSRSMKFCPHCSISLALGPPPEGALNLAAYEQIRELLGSCDREAQSAWRRMSNPQLTEGEVLPPLKTLRAVS